MTSVRLGRERFEQIYRTEGVDRAAETLAAHLFPIASFGRQWLDASTSERNAWVCLALEALYLVVLPPCACSACQRTLAARP